MTSQNYYDVTDWPEGDPREDIGQVINSIIRDIKKRQTDSDATTGFGKPGATIHIPSGDWRLATQVLIDVSYLRIEGDGHGFVSSSIRYNTDEERWPDLHEIWPGGSRVMVDLPARPDTDGRAGAAFLVERDGDPRISSVEFSGFNIDGLHFVDDGGTDSNPENSYVNGRTGIYVASPCDSFRIEGMGMVYLEHGLVVRGADALSAHGNFIAECGSCIELRDWGQASKVTDNLLGAGYKGRSIYAQRFGGLLVSGNNVFPRGAESVRLDDCARCTVTGNRLHSFYPGMLDLRGRCAENLVAANHLYRAWEPWPPMQMHGNGLDDSYGLLRVEGTRNTVVANHVSEIIDPEHLEPAGAVPVAIRVSDGSGNYIAANHVVAMTESAVIGDEAADSCFGAQVDAMLANERAVPLDMTAVRIDPSSTGNVVLDTATDAQADMDRSVNAFRPIPAIGA